LIEFVFVSLLFRSIVIRILQYVLMYIRRLVTKKKIEKMTLPDRNYCPLIDTTSKKTKNPS